MMAERRLRGGGRDVWSLPLPFLFATAGPPLPLPLPGGRGREEARGRSKREGQAFFREGGGEEGGGDPPPSSPRTLLLALRATPPTQEGMATGPGRPSSPPLFFFEKKKKRRRGGEGDGSWGRHSDGRAPGGAGSARCVRRLDGSLVPAIRITYRVSLRSSSSREPRYPSTGVVSGFLVSLFWFFFRRGKGRRRERSPFPPSPISSSFLGLPFLSPLPPPEGGGVRRSEGVYCQGFARGGPSPRRGRGAPTLRIRVARGLGRGGEKA